MDVLRDQNAGTLSVAVCENEGDDLPSFRPNLGDFAGEEPVLAGAGGEKSQAEKKEQYEKGALFHKIQPPFNLIF